MNTYVPDSANRHYKVIKITRVYALTDVKLSTVC